MQVMLSLPEAASVFEKAQARMSFHFFRLPEAAFMFDKAQARMSLILFECQLHLQQCLAPVLMAPQHEAEHGLQGMQA